MASKAALLALASLAPVPLFALSCDKPQPLAPVLPQVTLGTARLTGTVKLLGSPPKMELIDCVCNPAPGSRKLIHADRTVVTGSGGALADVFVYIKNAPLGSGAGEPALLLDQSSCDFEPHVLALQVGQRLRVRNSDPTFHNVHWDGQHNRAANLSFLPAPIGTPGASADATSAEQIVSFVAADFLPIRCDVHPWMKGTIAVFDNPFFSVTDAQGHFEISRLPPGHWTVIAYHPFYGPSAEQTIDISDLKDRVDSTPAQINFTFGSVAPP